MVHMTRLTFGTYAVKWMMYWIVFALFTSAETFTDVMLSFWLPMYYEMKVVIVIWLLSPATKGSSLLYRNFVHPILMKREQEIDEYIAKAKEQSYHTMLHLGSKGVTYATNVIMQTAIKNLPSGSGDQADGKPLTYEKSQKTVMQNTNHMENEETSDESRPSTPSPSTDSSLPPSSPAHNTRSRRGRKVLKAK